MLELFKLKVANVLVSNRKLAKKIKKHEKLGEELEPKIEEQLKIINASMYGEEPKTLISHFDKLYDLFREYYNLVVFADEEESQLYLLREEKDVEHLQKTLEHFANHVQESLPQDTQLQQQTKELLTTLGDDFRKFYEGMRASFKLLRDQKKEHERFRDKVFNFNKEHEQLHAARRLKKDSKIHKKLENEELQELHSLEKHLNHIDKLKKKGESIEKEKGEVENLFKELASDLSKDEKVLLETVQQGQLIIKYAVYHFFKAEEFKNMCLQLYRKLEPKLEPETRKSIHKRLDKFETWENGKERFFYKVGKKSKKEMKRDMKQTA